MAHQGENKVKLSELKARIDECFDDKNDKLMHTDISQVGIACYFINSYINLGYRNLIIEHTTSYDIENGFYLTAYTIDKTSKNIDINKDTSRDETREGLTPNSYLELYKHLEKRIEESRK